MPSLVRLACVSCDRDDFDEITPAELRRAEAIGWQVTSQQQTLRESRSEAGPLGVWWTHLGTCPDCAAEDAAKDARIAARIAARKGAASA